MQLSASRQLPFSRLHSNINLSLTSPNPLSSKRVSQCSGESSTVANIKNLCLSLLQTHNAVDIENIRRQTPHSITSKNSSKRFKMFKDRMVQDSSVRFQEISKQSVNYTISKSKEKAFYKNKIIDKSIDKMNNNKTNQSKSKSIQKKVFEYILDQYKDQKTGTLKSKSKHKNHQGQEKIMQYFQLKNKFMNKIQNLPNYDKYLTPKDIDSIFKECFTENVPESKWQLYVLNSIESRRKKASIKFI